MFVDPLLWVPAVTSLLAPVAAYWRRWAGWTVWALTVLATVVGVAIVVAAAALLGAFASLVLGPSPIHWTVLLPPAVFSVGVLGLSAVATAKVRPRGRDGRGS